MMDILLGVFGVLGMITVLFVVDRVQRWIESERSKAFESGKSEGYRKALGSGLDWQLHHHSPYRVVLLRSDGKESFVIAGHLLSTTYRRLDGVTIVYESPTE